MPTPGMGLLVPPERSDVDRVDTMRSQVRSSFTRRFGRRSFSSHQDEATVLIHDRVEFIPEPGFGLTHESHAPEKPRDFGSTDFAPERPTILFLKSHARTFGRANVQGSRSSRATGPIAGCANMVQPRRERINEWSIIVRLYETSPPDRQPESSPIQPSSADRIPRRLIPSFVCRWWSEDNMPIGRHGPGFAGLPGRRHDGGRAALSPEPSARSEDRCSAT